MMILHTNQYFRYVPKVLTISVCIPKASDFRSFCMDLEDKPKYYHIRTQNQHFSCENINKMQYYPQQCYRGSTHKIGTEINKTMQGITIKDVSLT